MSDDEVWRIFYQLVQALDYIHKDSIIHRNINPKSVYFRDAQKKTIKLGGFNISKKLDPEEKFSSTVLPNTHYLSPEQI
jgi:serine/threonine protein kinase